jgi:ferredoxin
MSVIGIDRETCNKCGSCVNDCVALRFEWDNQSEDVVFHKEWGCISCGHCIAVCPVDAVISENLPGKAIEFEGIQDISAILSYNNLFKLMRSKRSIRQYKNKKVPESLLKEILETMRYAPTGVNIRTLKCTVLSNGKVQEASEEILEA